MQTFTITIYFIILPSIFLVNDFDTKSQIAESNWYGTILTVFHCNYIKSEDIHEDNIDADRHSSEENRREM